MTTVTEGPRSSRDTLSGNDEVLSCLCIYPSAIGADATLPELLASPSASIRTETDQAFGRLFAKTEEADRKVADRVAEVAQARGVPRAQIALAWLLSRPVVTAPIVGATKLHQLDDAIASVNVKLSAGEIAALEEPYIPHAVVGFE